MREETILITMKLLQILCREIKRRPMHFFSPLPNATSLPSYRKKVQNANDAKVYPAHPPTLMLTYSTRFFLVVQNQPAPS